jgi:predicted ATP-grasp superfamily ATP-dependent carboligase
LVGLKATVLLRLANVLRQKETALVLAVQLKTYPISQTCTYQCAVVAIDELVIDVHEARRLLEGADGRGAVQRLTEMRLDGRAAHGIQALKLQQAFPAQW